MIGQKGPGRTYPGETCYHTDANGKRDCKEKRWYKVTSKGPYTSTLCEHHDIERRRADSRKAKAKAYAKAHGPKPQAEHAQFESVDTGHMPPRLSPRPSTIGYVGSRAYLSVMRRGSLGEAIQAEQRGAE